MTAFDATYLLSDLFTTDDPAPIVTPRTCEPGPGTLTFTDLVAGADFSVSGGKLLMPRPTGGHGYANYGFVATAGFSRSVGLMFYAIVQSSVFDRIGTGLGPAASPGIPGTGEVQFDAVSLKIGGFFVAGAPALNTDYQVAVVCRSTGYLFLIRGGGFTVWTLLHVSRIDQVATVYPRVDNLNADAKFDAFAMLQKSNLLATDYGKCSLLDPLATSGDTAVGEADGLSYLTWNPTLNDVAILYVRYTDDNNHIRLEASQAASTLTLYKRVAGIDTSLGTLAKSWLTDRDYRLGIIHAGSELRASVEDAVGSSLSAIAPVTDGFNAGEDGVKVAGQGISTLEVWPRTFAGTDETDIA